MKDFFNHLISKDNWLIKEENWDRELQSSRESLFTLGNGYIGSRGVLEEIPYDARSGTYIAGLYDKAGAQVTELVNLPNPINFKIISEGEKVDPVAMDVLYHQRILDMKKGLLKRRTQFSNSKKRRFDYQSLRFFSKDDRHLGVMKIYFSSLDKPVSILIEHSIDTSVTNKGILTEGRKEHFEITKLTNFGNINYLCIKTFESKISVRYASFLKVTQKNKSFVPQDRSFHLNLAKGETVCFTVMFSISNSRDGNNFEKKAIKSLRKSLSLGFDALLNKHIRAWEKIWEFSDISIKSEKKIERALRFNIYHMLICGNDFNERVSIGARTLSGEGYRGHIFWDTEIFILPFFIYTNPVAAKNMLLYRYHTLNAARMNAKVAGYKGALFAWESAESGFEVSPKWHKDLDGRVIKIHTGEMEDHIVANIAYAVNHYYSGTEDNEFMLKAGLEMLFETARFWASRGEFNSNKTLYHIRHIIGPDEFHTNVDNNAYTNALAKFNLIKAAAFYKKNKLSPSRLFRKLIKRISLTDREVESWENIAARMVIPINKKNGLIEAFKGYFQKRYLPIKETDRNFMPLLPKAVPLSDIGETQFVKQADVVMLLYLLSENFSNSETRKNFLYYDKRTLHKSSLSPSIYAIVGWKAKDYQRAFQYFNYALYADLKNHHGNTQEGIHAASLGGVWQVVINGFAGVKIKEDLISFNPHLPANFRTMKFRLRYKKGFFVISIHQKSFELLPCFETKDKIKTEVFNKIYMLSNNKKYVFSILSH